MPLRTFQRRVAAAAMVLALVATGCQARDRAGGHAGSTTTVLRFAVTGDPPGQMIQWADEIDQLSKGTVKITFVQRHQNEADYEAATIADVQAGSVELGWVGARAFDQVGLASFQPLVAPLLIDSLELEGHIFDAGIPQALLPTLSEIRLVGVGILPGPIRKVLGVAKPFITPADFHHQVVGIQASAIAEQTFTALGASPKVVPPSAKLTGLDAYDQQLSSIRGNHYDLTAKFVTANLDLWPRPLVIIANPTAYQRLTEDQRRMLTTAATDTIPASLAAERRGDASAITALCKAGLSFRHADDTDLTAIARTVQPVIEQIRTRPGNAAVLDKVTAIKRSLHRAPDTAECPDVTATDQATASPLDGTYEMRVVWPDVKTKDARCVGGDEAGPAGAIYDLELANGTMRLWIRVGGPDAAREIGDELQYRVFKDQLQFLETDGSTTTWDYTYRDNLLTLDNPRNPQSGVGCGGRAIFTTKPWVRQ